MDEHAQRILLRRVRLSLYQDRFITQDGSIALPRLGERDWPTEASLSGIEPGQLMFIEALPHT